MALGPLPAAGVAPGTGASAGLTRFGAASVAGLEVDDVHERLAFL